MKDAQAAPHYQLVLAEGRDRYVVVRSRAGSTQVLCSPVRLLDAAGIMARATAVDGVSSDEVTIALWCAKVTENL